MKLAAASQLRRSAPAAAQGQAGGVPTETQEREKSGGDGNILWNIIGLVGLLGLRGLWRESDNDGYTDDPVCTHTSSEKQEEYMRMTVPLILAAALAAATPALAQDANNTADANTAAPMATDANAAAPVATDANATVPRCRAGRAGRRRDDRPRPRGKEGRLPVGRAWPAWPHWIDPEEGTLEILSGRSCRGPAAAPPTEQ